MNKTDLIDRVAMSMDTTKTAAAKAVEAVFEAIRDGVHNDAKVTIAGFGTFVRRDRSERIGINPVTKEPMTIEASRTCAFRAAPALREALEPKKDIPSPHVVTRQREHAHAM